MTGGAQVLVVGTVPLANRRDKRSPWCPRCFRNRFWYLWLSTGLFSMLC